MADVLWAWGLVAFIWSAAAMALALAGWFGLEAFEKARLMW